MIEQWQRRWWRTKTFGSDDLREKGMATDEEMVMRTKMMEVVEGRLNSGEEAGEENGDFNRCR